MEDLTRIGTLLGGRAAGGVLHDSVHRRFAGHRMPCTGGAVISAGQLPHKRHDRRLCVVRDRGVAARTQTAIMT